MKRLFEFLRWLAAGCPAPVEAEPEPVPPQRCGHCGSFVSPERRFCRRCGTHLG